jgi:hypothetical protein
MDGLLRGVLGILLGAWLYAEAYPFLRGNLLATGTYGKLTLAGILGVNHWAVILPLVAVGVAALLWLDRRRP